MSNDNLPAIRHSVNDIEVMAKQVSQSGLFGMNQAQLFTLMLLAQAKGIHPIQAVERFHVIQGRPAMKADAMLADFQAAGGKVKYGEHSHTKCEATFTAPCLDEPVTVAWTIEDAKKAELLKNPMWSKYSRQMLRSRVISEGIRMAMPGIVAGIYTPEEASDFEPARQTTARVVEPRPAFTNNTGHKSGKYASDAETDAYKAWLARYVEEVNAKWLDHWTDPKTHELPNDIADLINVWRLSNHLCKWLRETGMIQAPEDFKVAQTDRLVAIIHAADRPVVEGEARVYCRKLWGEEKARIEAGEPQANDEPGDEEDAADIETSEAGSRG